MPILDWRELQHAVEQKQSGKAVNPNNPAYNDVDDELTRAQKWEQFKQEQDAIDAAGISGRYQRLNEGQKAYRKYISDLVDEAAKEDFYDYGESRYDKRVPFETWAQDPVDYRANAQSAASKLINGIAKAVPYTATTFLDNTLGTVAGLIGLGVDALDFNDDGTKASSFISNPFSEAMQSIRDWSDENLPNYRTQEEIDDQDHWWKHLNANFFGDTLMKNLGFTFGAMLSGVAMSKAFKAFQPKALREAYKAGVAASVGGNKEAEKAFQQVLQGARIQNPKKIYDTFAGMRDAYKRLDLANQFIAGMGGAVGESRVEAISAAQEFRDDAMANLNTRKDQLTQTLISEIAGNKAYITDVPVYDGYGNIIDYKKTINDAGRDALQKGLEQINQTFAEESKAIDEQAENIAKRVFALNLPVVGSENALMFGRLFSGGYRTQARARVRGNMRKGYRGMSKGESIARTAGKAASEGVEEITQKIISEGRKDIAMQNMSAFHDGQYDKEAMQDISDSFLSMANTAGQVLASPASWQEFTVGLLTGAIIDPVTGGYKAAANQRRESVEAAKALNERVSDPQFQNLYKGLVRHKYLENRKQKDLEAGDEYAWHGDNDEQIISDVMMFAKAGRLNDLEDMVDSISNIDEKNISKIKSDFIDETDPEFSSKSDAQMVQWLKDRGEEVKETIRQYRDFRESLDYMAFGTSDEDAIDELTFTQLQLEKFEKRYNKILDGVIAKVRHAIENIADEKTQDGKPTARAERAQKILSSEQNLRTLFGGYALDIEGRAQDRNSGAGAFVPMMLDDQRQERTLKELEDWGAFASDKNTKQEVKDLQKLIRSRQDFYSKLANPTFRQSFEKSKKKVDDVVKTLEKDANIEKAKEHFAKVQPAATFADYFNALSSLPEMDDATSGEFWKMVDADPKLKGFSDQLSQAGQFLNSVDEELNRRSGLSASPEMINALNQIHEEIATINPGQAVADNPDAASVEEAIAKTLMDRTALLDEKATDILKDILKEKLGDKFKSDSLGTVSTNLQPVAPEGNTQEEPDKDAIAQEAVLSELISKTTSLNDTLLNKILKGDFSDYPLLDGSQKETVSALARQKEKELKEAEGMIVIEDSQEGHNENRDTEELLPESMPEQSPQHQAFVKRDTNAVRGAIPGSSVYNINKLSGAGQVEIDEKRDLGVQATADWMRAHKVQEFLDSGAMMDLYEFYQRQGRQMPIFFLANPHLVDDNLSVNPFVVSSDAESMKKYGNTRFNTLLAIEVTDENRAILEKYRKENVFSDNTMLEVDGVKYQVIGQTWNPTMSQINAKPESEREAYTRMRDKSWQMEEYARKSIYRQYQADKAKAGEAGFTNAGKWYVADIDGQARLYTTLNYVTPGWDETREPGQKEYQQIPLSQSMKNYKALGKDYHFMLQTKTDQFYTKGAPQMPMEIDAPVGSLWMATKRADGSWAWTYITIARTGEVDFSALQGTKLMSRVNNALKDLFAPVRSDMSKNDYDLDVTKRLEACRRLEDIFYLGSGNQFRFVYGPRGIEVYVGDRTRACANADEVFAALKDGNYRFQVDTSLFNTGLPAFEELIDAGILSSEMRDFIRKGSMVGVNFLEEADAQGNPVTIHPVDGGLSVTIDSIGRSDVTLEPGTVPDIRLGDEGYRLNPDGTVQKEGTGEVVNDGTVIAQVKAMAEVMAYLKNDSINDYPGKRWVIEKPGQYTELYEQEVDGVTVRMHREGMNGAVMPMYDDARFDALVSEAEKKDKAPAMMSADDIINSTAKEIQQEKKSEEKPKEKKKSKPRKSLDMSLVDKDITSANTVQEAQKKQEEKEDTVDCG